MTDSREEPYLTNSHLLWLSEILIERMAKGNLIDQVMCREILDFIEFTLVPEYELGTETIDDAWRKLTGEDS